MKDIKSILDDYVLRKISDLYFLINIKNNTLYEIDEDAYIIFNSFEKENNSIDYQKIGEQIGKSPLETEEMIKEFLSALS
jgi:hypothetical protein